jgi:DNA-directed RNA polymerase alpha subunit
MAQAHTKAASGGELDGLRLAKPALRTLRAAGYDSLAKLARASDTELLQLHGMGKNALRTIREHAPAMRS